MLINYFIVALRNIARNKLFTLINITGLAIGMTACLMISLFVIDELSFDKFWSERDRVYRLHTSFYTPGRDPSLTVQAPGPMKHLVDRHLGSLASESARIVGMETIVSTGDQLANETIHWVDPGFARIFDLDVVAGSLSDTLADKSSLAVSEAFAFRQFGETDVIGNTLTLSVRDLKRDYRIGAVFRDLPRNTVFAFETLISIHEEDFPGRFDGWTSVGGQLFVKLAENVRLSDLAVRMPAVLDQFVPLQSTGYEGLKASDLIQFQPMALPELYLNADGWGEMKATGDAETVIIMALLALAVLVIAGINFSNLSAARSSTRAREVAVRKVAGAKTGQLVFQFLGESVLLSLMALTVALTLVEILLPFYEEFVARDLSVHHTVQLAMFAFLVTVVVGILGGFYPALILSRFRPGKILKNNQSSNATGTTKLRNLLVVFQFSVSITLIVATVVIYSQLALTARVDRGFNPENLVILSGTRRSEVRFQQKALKDQLVALPGVVDAAYSWRVPGRGGGTAVVHLPGASAEAAVNVNIVGRGYDFLETYQTKLVAGRNYNPLFANDGIPSADDSGAPFVGTIVVNESAVRRFGFSTPEAAIGKTVQMVVGKNTEGPVKADLEIIGVSQDMHFYSLRDAVAPEVHELVKEGAPYLSLRHAGDIDSLLPNIERVWKQVAPGVPFEIIYADELLEAGVGNIERFGNLMAGFSLLAIVVACLGLYGLASVSAEYRVKEIAVRKILGASVSEIVRLLVWQFSRPVIMANLVSWPAATWMMLSWLQGFAYRIDEWLLVPLCLSCGLLALLIAWLTTGGSALWAARLKPVLSLRYE